MINNKMLKEPLFLEFNSSGVLDRSEQAIQVDTITNTNNLVSDYQYSILKDSEPSNNRNETNKEREISDSHSEQSLDNEDVMCYLPCFERDTRYGRIGVPNCFRGFGFNFRFLVDCFTD